MSTRPRRELTKAPTGIRGLDELTGGGFSNGRPTLICGKTLAPMEFIVREATQFHEPGVFMAFEETTEKLTQQAQDCFAMGVSRKADTKLKTTRHNGDSK